jgi:Ca2+-transporting ATPase
MNATAPPNFGRTRASAESASPERPAHALSVDATLAAFGADAACGLSESRATDLRASHGFNELTAAPPAPWWRRAAGQFRDLVIWVLLGAALFSAVAGHWVDAVVILAIVALDGLIGFLQEERAGRALAALQRLALPQARVIRDRQLRVVPARDLVPGDRIEIEAGDHVPADARLIRSTALRVHEAALTGESAPVEKDHRPVLAPQTPVADRSNLIHMGTLATGGKASAVVVATGMRTQLGRIAGMLAAHEPEPTPLQRRLAALGRLLVAACLAIVAVIAALQLFRGGRLTDVLLPAVSLAVAAVPEGMPAVVTIALALGLQRMAKRNALIRRLPGVETLGSVTVVCSDKTGTLTRNEMTVREIHCGGRRYDVTGAGYDPRGEFLHNATPVIAPDVADLRQALTIGLRCGNATVGRQVDGGWRVIGDPTEGALVVAAMKGGITKPGEPGPPLFEIPFDSDRRAMSVVIPDGNTGAVMHTKGAVEVILGLCTTELIGGVPVPLTGERRRKILAAAEHMAGRALRVLALAYRRFDERVTAGTYPEADLIFAALIGMIDPPRDEARRAVETCRAAGIRPVMITGDHPDTALAIARELGVAAEPGQLLTGARLDQLTDAELAATVPAVAVYARVTAAHKLRIVRALRAAGEVVAMTGDGVNDAPAVQAADIGIAMGAAGADVTKEAADMVLVDDNFATIVAAIEEGRGIFENIVKVVHYLLASNASELMFVFVATLVGWPAPLLAVQILWINLVTDSLPALGLGTEPPEPGAMRRRPRPRDEGVIDRRRGLTILLHGVLMAAAALAAFALVYDGDVANLARARTAAFCVLALSQLLYALTCRSLTRPLTALAPFSNPRLLAGVAFAATLQLSVLFVPFARTPFQIEPPARGATWLLLAGLSMSPAALIELSRAALYRRMP